MVLTDDEIYNKKREWATGAKGEYLANYIAQWAFERGRKYQNDCIEEPREREMQNWIVGEGKRLKEAKQRGFQAGIDAVEKELKAIKYSPDFMIQREIQNINKDAIAAARKGKE